MELAIAINDLMRFALKQTNGNESRAAARLFTVGAEWSLSLGHSELLLSERLFTIARNKEDAGP